MQTSNILYLIDAAHLNSEERIVRAIHEWPLARLTEIRGQLWELLKANSDSAVSPTDVTDPFDFVASASMRGEDGCFAWDCRLQKARTLARYGALYARRLLIPIRLGIYPGEMETESALRYGLAGTLMSILVYRPLVENGIAFLSAGALQLCKDHFDEAVPVHPKVEAVSNALFRKEFRRFKVSLDHARGSPDVLVEGPEEYLQHGKLWFGAFNWLSDTSRSKAREKNALPIKVTQAVRSAAVRGVFRRFAYDVTIHQFYTLPSNATYLTDMAGEARVLALLNSTQEERMRDAMLMKHLLHSVPLLSDVPIAKVLKFRTEEPEAFIQYRTAVAKILRECSNSKCFNSERDVKNIYRDILEPELARLKIQAREIRRMGIKKATVKSAASFIAVGLGVYGGLLPSDLAGMLKVAGGVGLLSQIGEAVGLIERNPGEIKNHNLYFLLRMENSQTRQ